MNARISILKNRQPDKAYEKSTEFAVTDNACAGENILLANVLVLRSAAFGTAGNIIK